MPEQIWEHGTPTEIAQRKLREYRARYPDGLRSEAYDTAFFKPALRVRFTRAQDGKLSAAGLDYVLESGLMGNTTVQAERVVELKLTHEELHRAIKKGCKTRATWKTTRQEGNRDCYVFACREWGIIADDDFLT